MATVVESYTTYLDLHPMVKAIHTARQTSDDPGLDSPDVSSPDLSPSDLRVLKAVATSIAIVRPVYLAEGASPGHTYDAPDGIRLIVAGGSRLSIESTSTPIGFETVVQVWDSDGKLMTQSTVGSTVPWATQYAAAAGLPFNGGSPAPPPDSAASAVATGVSYRLQAEQREALLNLLVTLVTGADKGLMDTFASLVDGLGMGIGL